MQVPQQHVAGAGAEQGIQFAAAFKGQAVTALVGACAYNVLPLIMDLTDGEVHHLLHVKGNELFVWTDLEPRQVWMGPRQGWLCGGCAIAAGMAPAQLCMVDSGLVTLVGPHL